MRTKNHDNIMPLFIPKSQLNGPKQRFMRGFNIVFCVLQASIVGMLLGCTKSRPPTGIFIPNGFRVSVITHDFDATTSPLRLVAEIGKYESVVRLENIIVNKGALTFHGDNGSIAFLPGNRVSVTTTLLDDHQIFDLKTYDNHDFTFSVDFRLHEFRMSVMTVVAPVAELETKYRQNITEYFSPKLHGMLSEGYYVFEIPFEKSGDFSGSIGNLVLVPTWYNGRVRGGFVNVIGERAPH